MIIKTKPPIKAEQPIPTPVEHQPELSLRRHDCEREVFGCNFYYQYSKPTIFVKRFSGENLNL